MFKAETDLPFAPKHGQCPYAAGVAAGLTRHNPGDTLQP